MGKNDGITNKGKLLEKGQVNDRDMPQTRNENNESIRVREVAVADWQQWQVLYRLRRNRVFVKILSVLGGNKQ